MIQLLRKIFSASPKPDYAEMYRNGAQIIDVRTKAEYKAGHLSNSMNIPLQDLSKKIGKLKKDRAIITCCASGMRSATAKNMLMSNGFQQVHNGGSWRNLKTKLQ